jgi:hypothetical protein
MGWVIPTLPAFFGPQNSYIFGGYSSTFSGQAQAVLSCGILAIYHILCAYCLIIPGIVEYLILIGLKGILFPYNARYISTVELNGFSSFLHVLFSCF